MGAEVRSTRSKETFRSARASASSASAFDRGRAVIPSVKRYCGESAGQLTGDLAGSTAQVGNQRGVAHVPGGKVGKAPDRDVARVGEIEGVVVLAFEDLVVKVPIGVRGPSCASSPEVARRAPDNRSQCLHVCPRLTGILRLLLG